MKKTLILILLAFAPCLTLLAADGDGDITLSNVSITSDSSQVAVSMGMVLDGITNGNIAIPAVRMMQASVREENTNAHAALSIRAVRMVSSGRTTPSAGIAHRIGVL